MRAFFLLATMFLVMTGPMLGTAAVAHADDYILRDGQWWRGGLPYNRSQVKVYTSPGCYYYRYDYYPAPIKVVEKITEKIIEKPVYPPAVAPKGWRQQLLEMAEARDKFEQAQSAATRDHKEYLEAIKALGLGRPQAVPYGYAYSTQASTYGAVQGSTVYGYSLSTVNDVLGDNQIGVWMQQAARAQQAAQATAEKGLGGIFGAIELEGSNRARVASILAKAEVLKSLDTPEAHTTTKVEVQGALPPNGLPPVPNAPQAPAADLQGLFGNKCAKCHSQQGTIQGKSDLFPQGVDLAQYPSFSYDQKKRVLETVLTGEMPKGGDPLTFEETGLIYADVLAARNAKQE